MILSGLEIFRDVNFHQNRSAGNRPTKMLICGKVAKSLPVKGFSGFTK
jgi:hypothetical protein